MTLRVYAIWAAVFVVGASLAAGQGSAGQVAGTRTMSATGAVTSVSANSLVIEGKEKKSITFTVDAKTRVFKRGATVRILPVPPLGRSGPSLVSVVHPGDLVTVRFQIVGTTIKATEIRVLSKSN